MPLADLLAPERIAILVDIPDRQTALDHAARLLAGPRGSAAAIAAALQAREALASTAIGYGVAIPHARSTEDNQAIGAFLRLRPAVDFDAADGQAVDLVFAMHVPQEESAAHLQRLAQLAEMFAHYDFRERLRSARDADALRRCLLSS